MVSILITVILAHFLALFVFFSTRFFGNLMLDFFPYQSVICGFRSINMFFKICIGLSYMGDIEINILYDSYSKNIYSD